MSKRVTVGESFDGTSADKEKESADQTAANTEQNESRTRSHIAYGTGSVGVTSMAIAGAFGLYDGTFDELSNVWVAFGPISGAIVGYYFGGKTTKDEGR